MSLSLPISHVIRGDKPRYTSLLFSQSEFSSPLSLNSPPPCVKLSSTFHLHEICRDSMSRVLRLSDYLVMPGSWEIWSVSFYLGPIVYLDYPAMLAVTSVVLHVRILRFCFHFDLSPLGISFYASHLPISPANIHTGRQRAANGRGAAGNLPSHECGSISRVNPSQSLLAASSGELRPAKHAMGWSGSTRGRGLRRSTLRQLCCDHLNKIQPKNAYDKSFA